MDKKYVFGPVLSKRLGYSLGIDLIPLKTCSYECIYCQLGKTTDKRVKRKSWGSIYKLFDQLDEKLKSSPKIDYITFSGSGEPTLNMDIGIIINEIKKITEIPVAVLTNGSILFNETVQKDLNNADLIIPSLDAVNESQFELINRPHHEITYKKMFNGLFNIRKWFKKRLYLEIMFVKDLNDKVDDIPEYKKLIERIDPDLVYLNTVTRPPSENYAMPSDPSRLECFAKNIFKHCLIVDDTAVSENFDRYYQWRDCIISALSKRPLTIFEMEKMTGMKRAEIVKLLHLLENKNVIKSKNFSENTFYYSSSSIIYKF